MGNGNKMNWKGYVIGCIGGLLLFGVLRSCTSEPEVAMDEEIYGKKETKVAAPKAEEPGKPTNADAYGMCCQAIRNGYPSAENFKMSPRECVDYGNGVWMIVGYADIMERRVRWAAEIQHHADDTWQLTTVPSFVDVGQGER